MRRLRVASRTAFFKDLPDLIKVISVFFGFLLGRDDDPGWKIRNKKESAGFDRRSCCSGRVTEKKKKKPKTRAALGALVDCISPRVSLDFTRFHSIPAASADADWSRLRRFAAPQSTERL